MNSPCSSQGVCHLADKCSAPFHTRFNALSCSIRTTRAVYLDLTPIDGIIFSIFTTYMSYSMLTEWTHVVAVSTFGRFFLLLQRWFLSTHHRIAFSISLTCCFKVNSSFNFAPSLPRACFSHCPLLVSPAASPL